MTFSDIRFSNVATSTPFARRRARVAGQVNGKRVLRVPVEVTFERLSGAHLSSLVIHTDVLAHSPAEAANAVKDAVLDLGVDHCFTVSSIGPQGGMQHRCAGWWSIIGSHIGAVREFPTQLGFNL